MPTRERLRGGLHAPVRARAHHPPRRAVAVALARAAALGVEAGPHLAFDDGKLAGRQGRANPALGGQLPRPLVKPIDQDDVRRRLDAHPLTARVAEVEGPGPHHAADLGPVVGDAVFVGLLGAALGDGDIDGDGLALRKLDHARDEAAARRDGRVRVVGAFGHLRGAARVEHLLDGKHDRPHREHDHRHGEEVRQGGVDVVVAVDEVGLHQG